MTRPGLFLCLGTVVLLSACATAAPGLVTEDPEIQRALEGRSPLPFTVYVAPPAIDRPDPDSAQEAYPRGGSKDAGPADPESAQVAHPIGMDGDDFRKRVREIAFDSIKRVGVFASTLAPGEGVEGDPERFLSAARRAGADLYLDFRLRSIHCRHEGPNSLWLPNLILWYTLWFPSLWVADQRYIVEAEAEYSLRSTQNGEAVYGGQIHVEAPVDLDYLDRDVGWLGLIRLDDSEANWMAIMERVRPHALFALEKAFLLTLLKEFDPFARSEQFLPLVYPGQSAAREVAIVIGVSDYRDRDLQLLCRYGVLDAESYRERLSGRKGSHLGKEGIEFLVGSDASRRQIYRAFFKFNLAGTQHRDRISVYFSGVGASEKRQGGGYEFYLLPHDADPGDLESTAISLRDLQEWLARANADEVVVVVDAGFGSKRGGKGVRRFDRADAVEEAAFREALRALSSGKGRGVIFAGRPGEAVAESAGDSRGLLTYYLLSHLEGKGDLDGDGKVTLGEIKSIITDKVRIEAELMGMGQTPLILGDEGIILSEP